MGEKRGGDRVAASALATAWIMAFHLLSPSMRMPAALLEVMLLGRSRYGQTWSYATLAIFSQHTDVTPPFQHTKVLQTPRMNTREKYVAIAVSTALLAVLLWRVTPSPPKVRIHGHRIHHGLVGAALFVVGALSKRPHIAAAGAVLAVDDIEDLLQWLDFAESGTGGTGHG